MIKTYAKFFRIAQETFEEFLCFVVGTILNVHELFSPSKVLDHWITEREIFEGTSYLGGWKKLTEVLLPVALKQGKMELRVRNQVISDS